MYWKSNNQHIGKSSLLYLLIGCLAFTAPARTASAAYTSTAKKAIQLYNEAARHYISKEYAEAIQLLEQAIKKDRKFVEAYLKLATIYQHLDDLTSTTQLLDQAYSYIPPAKYEHLHYDMARLYYRSGLYSKAQTVLQALSLTEVTSPLLLSQVHTLQENLCFALEKTQHPIVFKPRRLPAPLNQFVAQYFPVLTVDQQSLLFTARTGYATQCRENLYISHKDQNGNWSAPQSISDQINATASNEGTCTISADKKTLMFTSCLRKGNFGTCDLYVSYQKGGVWSAPKNLGPSINSAGWESQPSLSADGKTLYFVSDRKGNYGKKDIWKSTLQEKGQWSKAINLGPIINSQGQEIAPFIHPNGQTLLFASDRSPSMGGFDIYYTNFIDGHWTEPVNLGYPINNHQDQVSLYITADGEKAYYADGKQQGSNYYSSCLYEFDMPASLVPMPRSDLIKVKVLDAKTKKNLSAQVEVYDIALDTCQAIVQVDESDGEATVVVNEGKEYMIYINKDGHLFESMHVDYKNQNKAIVSPKSEVCLRSIEVEEAKILQNIYFDFDDYMLEERSKIELNRLVAFLQANPHITIELAGHTDQLGPEDYNYNLSVKRAQAIYKYLITAGISPDKLSYKGYGRSRPIAPNDSPINRQLNRRTAFRITSIHTGNKN